MFAEIALLILSILILVLLAAEGLLKKKSTIIISVVLIVGAMVVRGMCMDYETLDYQNFLHVWVETYRKRGGFALLGQTIGNYNIPYNYFLALFSYLNIRDLYLIKLLSITFDIILAWGVMRLVGLFRNSAAAKLCGFFIPFYLPTVILNGALWGQCDSIYVAFAVWALWAALAGRPIRSVVFIALSFAFKMQAVFLMPFWLVLLFAKRVKWHHLAAFPITYVLAVLPAILLGRPLKDALYVWQAGSIGSGLNYNSSSVFAFVRSSANEQFLSKLGIIIAFVFLFLLFLFCWIERRRLDNARLLICAVLICTAVPFFLPHMHDRYFFMADILTTALAVVLPTLSLLPVCTLFASLLGYHAYLKMQYLLPMRYGAAALVLVILVLILRFCLSAPNFEKTAHNHNFNA